MNPVALLLIADEIVIKNPHYAYCMTLDPNGWEWLLHGCFIYDPTNAVAAAASMALAIGAAKVVRFIAGHR